MALTTLAVGSALYGGIKSSKAAKKAKKAAKKQQAAYEAGVAGPPREATDTVRLGMADWHGGGMAKDSHGNMLYNSIPEGAMPTQKPGLPSGLPADFLARFPMLAGLRGGFGPLGGFGGLQGLAGAAGTPRPTTPPVKAPMLPDNFLDRLKAGGSTFGSFQQAPTLGLGGGTPKAPTVPRVAIPKPVMGGATGLQTIRQGMNTQRF